MTQQNPDAQREQMASDVEDWEAYEDRREKMVRAARALWWRESSPDEQLEMLVDLYRFWFETVGEPRQLPQPDWFDREVQQCWREEEDRQHRQFRWLQARREYDRVGHAAVATRILADWH
jgi:hypothetical protein